MRHLPVVFFLVTAGATAQPYQHVVVTADSFAARLAPLCSWLETELGLNDTIVSVTDVCAVFPGRDDPERIRNFIRHAYENWGATHVLLGGDVEIVPCRRAWVDASYYHPLLKDSIPCDLYFADLDGDWDGDGDGRFGEPEDSCDLYPDLFVGRLPATSAAEADLLVGKFLAYTGDPEAEYLDQILLAGFDIFTGVHCETTMELYDTLYVPASMKPANKEYDSEPGRHIGDVVDHLNQGQHVWVHADHCNYFGMGMGYMEHGDVLYREQLGQLTNRDEYTIMTSLGCCTGEFDTSDCASEMFLLAPNGGGIATATNSRYGVGDGGNPQRGRSFRLVEGFVRGLFEDREEPSVGAGVVTAWSSTVALADTNLVDRWCLFCWNLLGEPAMPVWVPLQSSVSDRPASVFRLPGLPSIARGTVCVTEGFFDVVDASGRRVSVLRAGENDISRLAPGVYYVRSSPSGEAAKLVIQR